LVIAEEDPIHTDDEEDEEESEVHACSIVYGSTLRDDQIQDSAWNREIIDTLLPLQVNPNHLPLDALKEEVRTAIETHKQNNPSYDHSWR